MADAYAETGVTYLSMNINHHHGGYPFGRPAVPFFWESPSGKRILTWSGFAYHRDNVLGLMGAQAPESNLIAIPGFSIPNAVNGWTDIHDISFAERRLLPLLEWMENTGYAYDFLPVMGSGLYTDNSPPGEQYCQIIREWNEKHGDKVHVRTATLAEFFDHLEKNVRDLAVHRGEWTDWWSDGPASTPVDTILYRNAQRSRIMISSLDPKRAIVSPAQLTAIDKKLLLYPEHTFGYSHTSDTTLLAHQAFTRKSKHAIEADELASAALYKVLRSRGEGQFVDRRLREYKVINPLNTPTLAIANLHMNHWEAPFIAGGIRVLDYGGKVYPHQLERIPRGSTSAIIVELAPGEERIFRIDQGPKEPLIYRSSAAQEFETQF